MTATEKKINIPELRFPEFEGEWVNNTLSELLIFKNGLNASKENYGHGYKFINVLDIINNNFITHDTIIGSVNVSENEFNKNIVEYGDILFQRSSETREEVGQANVYLDRNKPATFGGFVIRGKKKADYNPVFLNYLLKTANARKEITSKSGGSTRYNVGQDILSEVKILISSLPEQQKIATFFTAVDKRIHLLTQKKEKLEQYKKGVMQKLFSRELRFRDGNGKDYPDWKEKRLSEVSTITTGSSNRQDSGLEGTYTFFDRSIDIRKSDIYLFDAEAIIVAGEGQDFIPKHFIGKFDLHQRTYAIMYFKGVYGKFLYYYIFYHRNYFYTQAVGSTVKSLRMPMFQKMVLRLPTPSEQQKIASFLSAIDKQINQAEHQIKYSTQWKKGLMQKMFI